MERPGKTIILSLPTLCDCRCQLAILICLYNMTNEMDADAALALTAESPEFADTVGIKAVDDYTLQYTCLSEKPYFDTVAAYGSLIPTPVKLRNPVQ